MVLSIIGTRNKGEYEDIKQLVNAYLTQITKITSGGAGRSAEIAKRLAQETGKEYGEYLPDYQKYGGKLAPILRAKEMVKEADIIAASWDGKSKGTEHEIKEAKRLKKRILIKMI
jgi:D-arabinose 5-phosphate isomerase GutQ